MKSFAIAIGAAGKFAAVAFMLATATVAARTGQPDDHSSHHLQSGSAPSADIAWTQAEVRKVDKNASKLTLRHGPIPNLEMPEMTMAFRVADPRLLDGLEAKQKVRFTADRIGGQLTVTSLEVVQ